MTTGDGWVCVDGNEAAARVAHRLSEVIAIYPITPASTMGELADTWSAAGRPNLWGQVPEVVELQSEAGAAGVLHGAVLKGALATTFTASQGLLLMLPNMFKIAGELTPTVIHVAARTVATHALSIFGDHSDVMAARPCGWAMLAAGSVQEAHDLALVAHASTLASRVPFLHFFDGFRTSHEVAKIQVLDDDDLRALVDPADVAAHRDRGLSPDRPQLRGSAQNPDVFFQAREAANPFYGAVPGIVQAKLDQLAERTGRRYGLVDYAGDPEAERVVVLMGSAAGAAAEAVEALCAAGEKVGLVTVRLYRPFPAEALAAALPATVRQVAVLDRTKEPGAAGEPLYQDVVCALAERAAAGGPAMPQVVGGRYGLASKEFTPAMVKAVLDNLAAERPRNHFTVGIADDVSHSSLTVDTEFSTEDADGLRAVFFGLGSDGTVGANKTSVKIVGEGTDLFAQGYFVLDSKKSGSVTVSHLRMAPRPIRSSYLIGQGQATFVACHQFHFLDRMDVLGRAEEGATFLLNSPWPADQVFDRLPFEVQQEIIDKRLDLWVVDAARVAREVGMGHRINTVMQPCFFALAGVLPREQAVAAIKAWVSKAFSRRGEEVVARNFAAVDRALDGLRQVQVPGQATATRQRRPTVSEEAPDFVKRVTARMMEGNGDLLPVSALPVDGAFPTGTARWEKRQLAAEIPIWDPSICIDCGKCAIVCPHSTIRMKVFAPEALEGAPDGFEAKDFRSRDLPGMKLVIQVAPDDCTGCGVCVEVCPAHSKEEVKHKAINMTPVDVFLERERERWDFFEAIGELDRGRMAPDTVKGSQVRQPLFEFSGACAGCGETQYLKLISQLFGDRLLVANATGCSSIYGGNLPTTPWTVNAEGRGPAWANSLFEDNAEFGLGIRLAADRQHGRARQLLEQLAPQVGDELAAAILTADQQGETEVAAQRDRVAELRARLAGIRAPGGLKERSGSPPEEILADARELEGLAGELVRRSVWIVGGDGWAYDIGSGGVDAVLASGQNVNLLVLDTEVYSNTGGQASKASPRGAVAKFAARGKPTAKKDLGMLAMAYGNVYVAHVAVGSSDMQTVKALLEAEAWPGPSLVIAYSTCIAHGFDMAGSMAHMRDAVRSGHWPLYRYHPEAERPFHLDSKPPTLPLREFAASEARFAMLARTAPEEFERLMALAEEDAAERWRHYEQLTGVARVAPHLPTLPVVASGPAEEEAP